jgi:hypothetical protein
VLAAQEVDAGQSGVRGAVGIDRVGLKTHPLPVARQRLDLIEQDDRGSVRRELGDGLYLAYPVFTHIH